MHSSVRSLPAQALALVPQESSVLIVSKQHTPPTSQVLPDVMHGGPVSGVPVELDDIDELDAPTLFEEDVPGCDAPLDAMTELAVVSPPPPEMPPGPPLENWKSG